MDINNQLITISKIGKEIAKRKPKDLIYFWKDQKKDWYAFFVNSFECVRIRVVFLEVMDTFDLTSFAIPINQLSIIETIALIAKKLKVNVYPKIVGSLLTLETNHHATDVQTCETPDFFSSQVLPLFDLETKNSLRETDLRISAEAIRLLKFFGSKDTIRVAHVSTLVQFTNQDASLIIITSTVLD